MPENLEDVTGLDDSRLYAAMAYLLVLVFVPWLVRRNDPFVSWHVRQGIVVLAGVILALIIAAWWSTVGSLLFLVLLIGDVIALVQALQGKRWKIPGIGQLANRIRL